MKALIDEKTGEPLTMLNSRRECTGEENDCNGICVSKRQRCPVTDMFVLKTDDVKTLKSLVEESISQTLAS